MGYKNRGQSFEAYVEYSNNVYLRKGEGLIVKQHTHFIPLRNRQGKVVSCKVEEKAICDYIGIFLGQPVAIEAKDTQQGNIRYDAVKPHQAQFLTDFEALGGHSFVIVSFTFAKFFCIPWEFWKHWMNCCKTERFEYYKGWQPPNKKSARPFEFLDLWEVKPGRSGALDYLKSLRG